MNKLIVESENDKAFIEALIRHLQNQNIEVDSPVCRIDDFDCLHGLDEKKLTRKLEDVFDDVRKKGLSKIGILIDQDNSTTEKRLDFINNCMKSAVKNKFFTDWQDSFLSVNTFKTIQADADTFFEVACHFTNVDGKGELETVLKHIKTQDSTHADCLEKWRKYLNENNKEISDKEFDKFWISNYIRFDTCSNKDKWQSERKCSMKNFDYVLEHKPHIFNFDEPILNDLKIFVQLFG